MNQKFFKDLNNKVTGGAVALMSVALGKKTIEYERVVYSFIDMFGFLGGLYDFMYISGYISFMFFQNKLLNFTILSRLYHIDVKQKKEQQPDCSKISPLGIFMDNRSSITRCNKIKKKDEINKEEEDGKELEYTITPSINPYMQTDHEKIHIEDNSTAQKVK